MSTLANHIKDAPEKSLSQWAKDLGISRPYLYALIDGSRVPSLPVAQKIEAATGRAVPVASWPNMAAILSATQNTGDAA